MNPTCNLELYLDGAWRDAAAVDLTGDAGRGIDASTVLAYSSAHALNCLDRRDAAALSAALPVSLTLDTLPGWPAFLVDLLPQGYGRREVLRQLQRPEYAEREADWTLLLAGAGNPVGVAPTHNEVCRRLGIWATDPLADIIEYVRRGLANIALGNKDNHGRNTAIQRRQDGTVALAPLFDFAPMWLHPDGIARNMRWERDDGGSPQWASAIAQAAQAAGLDEAAVRQGVHTLAEPLARVYQAALDLGIDEQAFLKPIEKLLLHVRAQLEAL